MEDLTVELCWIIAGVLFAAIGLRWKRPLMRWSAGSATAYGAGWIAYRYSEVLFQAWVKINPSVDPWQGMIWFIGTLVGGGFAFFLVFWIGSVDMFLVDNRPPLTSTKTEEDTMPPTIATPSPHGGSQVHC